MSEYDKVRSGKLILKGEKKRYKLNVTLNLFISMLN